MFPIIITKGQRCLALLPLSLGRRAVGAIFCIQMRFSVTNTWKGGIWEPLVDSIHHHLLLRGWLRSIHSSFDM